MHFGHLADRSSSSGLAFDLSPHAMARRILNSSDLLNVNAHWTDLLGPVTFLWVRCIKSERQVTSRKERSDYR
jgi:hypothetical protein